MGGAQRRGADQPHGRVAGRDRQIAPGRGQGAVPAVACEQACGQVAGRRHRARSAALWGRGVPADIGGHHRLRRAAGPDPEEDCSRRAVRRRDAGPGALTAGMDRPRLV